MVGRSTAVPAAEFLIFALATILAVGGLTTRLFYLQIVNGGQFATLSEGNRTAVEAIPSARGLIYDRKGVALVKNVPTFAVKIRPVDLPDEPRDDVVARLAALLKMDAGRHQRRDRQQPRIPSSISSASRPTSRRRRRGLIAEARLEPPGV